MNASEITRAVENLVAQIAPTAVRRKMYGGIVFESEPGNPQTRFGGYFVYAKHVGVEFSKGALFQDPDGLLQGKGKLRRHIKLTTVDDIENKRLAGFIEQAVKV